MGKVTFVIVETYQNPSDGLFCHQMAICFVDPFDRVPESFTIYYFTFNFSLEVSA